MVSWNFQKCISESIDFRRQKEPEGYREGKKKPHARLTLAEADGKSRNKVLKRKFSCL